MNKKTLICNLLFSLSLAFFLSNVNAQSDELSKKEIKRIQLSLFVKIGSGCNNSAWQNLTTELNAVFGSSENGEFIGQEFQCSRNAKDDYYRSVYNEHQNRNTKVYFFEAEKGQSNASNTFEVFSTSKELFSLIKGELARNRYSRKQKLALVIVEGRGFSKNWESMLENGWSLEKPSSDHDIVYEKDCNCKNQPLYKNKPCKNIKEFEFSRIDNMKLSAFEEDAIDFYPAGEEEMYFLQTPVVYCGEEILFKFYDDSNSLIKEMKFKSSAVLSSNSSNMKFRVYQDPGPTGSVTNHIAGMSYREIYTLKVFTSLNGEWVACPENFRISFQQCSLLD